MIVYTSLSDIEAGADSPPTVVIPQVTQYTKSVGYHNLHTRRLVIDTHWSHAHTRTSSHVRARIYARMHTDAQACSNAPSGARTYAYIFTCIHPFIQAAKQTLPNICLSQVKVADLILQDLLTIDVNILRNPCVNGGFCKGPETDPECKLTNRTEGKTR